MKKNICRVLALVMAVAMLVAASACTINVNVSYDEDAISAIAAANANANNNVAPAAPVTQAPVATTQAPVAQVDATTTPADTTAPAANTDATTQPAGSSESPSADATTTTAPAEPGSTSGLPSTNEEILAKYTEVVNQMKQVDQPTYFKVEYQELPEEYRNLGSAANTVLKLASGYMTDEETARSKASQSEKGHMGGIPIYNNSVSCLLTDASAIKSASCKDNGDGTATIVITLNDEENPQPAEENATTAPSNTGAMFAPMKKSDIDNTLSGIPGLTVNNFSLTYTDCTATLTYNTSDNHVVSFEQIMNVDINADAKLLISINGTARLVNTMIINNFVY